MPSRLVPDELPAADGMRAARHTGAAGNMGTALLSPLGKYGDTTLISGAPELGLCKQGPERPFKGQSQS